MCPSEDDIFDDDDEGSKEDSQPQPDTEETDVDSAKDIELGDDDAQSIARALKSSASGDRMKGVFSTQKIMKIGTGTTQRKTIQKTYWFIDEDEAGKIMVQPLNRNYVPSGPKKFITKDELIEKFQPEPEFYTYTVFPKMREMYKTITRAERHREKGEMFSAEYEYMNALKVDEENIRANFGLGITYLERGDKSKADDIFKRVVKLDAAFEAEHKHLFNEFGINLRKTRMVDQSIEYYERALQLTKDDENLFYNIARAYYEKGDFQKTLEHLTQALKLNSEFTEARQFLEYLKKKGLLDGSSAV